MKAFKDLPISQKLTRMIALTSSAAILATSALIVGYEVLSTRNQEQGELVSVADVIANSLTPAPRSEVVERVVRMVQALETNPDILVGRFYDRDGKLTASYTKPGRDDIPPGLEAAGEREWVAGRYIGLSHTISVGKEPLGMLVLVADRSEQLTRLRYTIFVVGLLTMVAVLVSLILAGRVQELVSRPIQQLAGVARAVAKEGNYSLRSVPESHDEVGELMLAFNQMLTQIEKSDTVVRASEERFRELAETINEVFWVSNVEKNQILYISPGYETIWGRSCRSLYERPTDWMEAIHPGDRGRVAEAARTKQANGEYDVEYRIVRPTGSIRWIRDRAYPIQEPDGTVRRVVGIAEDITDRKRAEDALWLQGEITRNMEEGILLVRVPTETIIYANPKFERIFGYETGELNGQSVAVLSAEETERSLAVGAQLLATLKKHGFWSGELYNRRKDGTTFWTSAKISSFEHPEYGQVRISVEGDITERKQAEEQIRRLNETLEQRIRERTSELANTNTALRESEKRLRLALDASDAGVWSWDVDTNQAHWDDHYHAQYGFEPHEPASQEAWMARVHPEDRDRLKAQVRKLLEPGAGDSWNEEFRIHHPSKGIRWMSGLGRVERDDTGRAVRFAGINLDVTERRQIEEEIRELNEDLERRVRERTAQLELAHAALQAQQKEQQAILNSTPALIWYKDRNNRMIRLNQAAADSVGKTVAELEGQLVAKFYPEEAEQYHRDDLEVIDSGKPKLGIIEPLATASGGKRWIQTDKVPFRDQRGEIIGVIVSSVDVTARVQIEDKLRQAEEKYRLLVERVPAVTYVAEPGTTGRWHYVSPQVETLFGFTAEEWMTDSGLWYRQIHSDDRGQVLQHEGPARERNRYDSEYRVVTKTGHVVWVRDLGTWMSTADGRPPQLHGVLFDITERKLAEQALHETEERLQTILDNSTAVIYLKAADGKYILINQCYERLFHISRTEVVGKTDFDIFPRETAESYRKNDQRVLREKTAIQFEEVAPQDDGVHTYISVKFPFRDASGEPYAVCGISTDITERKRLEKEILEVSDREQRRIGQDLHDGLCQLLTGTRFALRTLEHRLAEAGVSEATRAAEIAELLRRANIEARNVARGLHPLEIEAGGLAAALQELAISVRSLSKVACRFQCQEPVEIADKATSVHAYRIAQEAVNNALRHSQAKHIGIALAKANGTIALTVEDDGVGLPEKSGAVVGMGLNIMAYRARMIGGNLQVRRGTKRGTIVNLEFPFP